MKLFIILMAFAVSGCATLTNDAMQPVAFRTLGCPGSGVQCVATNKRGQYEFTPPTSVLIRRSDDVLKVECQDASGKQHRESVASSIGMKMAMSVAFLDLGITDAITDKHRSYPQQVLIQCDK